MEMKRVQKTRVVMAMVVEEVVAEAISTAGVETTPHNQLTGGVRGTLLAAD